MFRQLTRILIMVALVAPASAAHAEEKGKPPGMPPAIVVAAEVSSGLVAPESDFIGTVYYREVSDVASEMSGIVKAVSFEEGERVKKDQVLVRLSYDLLEKSLQSTTANYDEALSDLDKAQRDLERAKNLFAQELISEQTYDDRRFTFDGLGKKAASLKADVERLETELEKKSIRAPFDGVVLKKHADRGEWISPGSLVATVAMEGTIDVIANVSQEVIHYVKKGMDVTIRAGNSNVKGTVIAVIPRGDIATRTFPVKVRAESSNGLAEGMEAVVTLPIGKKEKTLIVPRDAVITKFGSTVVYTVNDGKAHMTPVTVIGYSGLKAGVQSQALQEGMKVVIKGNERLRPDQPVMIQKK